MMLTSSPRNKQSHKYKRPTSTPHQLSPGWVCQVNIPEPRAGQWSPSERAAGPCHAHWARVLHWDVCYPQSEYSPSIVAVITTLYNKLCRVSNPPPTILTRSMTFFLSPVSCPEHSWHHSLPDKHKQTMQLRPRVTTVGLSYSHSKQVFLSMHLLTK